MLSNKIYDWLKTLITVYLPATGVVYWGSWEVFDFEKVSNVNGTINGLIATLGLLLGYSSKKYRQVAEQTDGDLYVVQDPVDGEVGLKLGVENGPEDIVTKRTVKLVVKHIRQE